MHFLLQGVPLIIGVLVMMLSGYRMVKEPRYSFKITMLLQVIAMALLLFAQTSWWVTVAKGSTTGEWWANNIWLVFNTLTGIIMLIHAIPRKRLVK